MAETHGKCPRCGSTIGTLNGGVLCPVCLLDACLAEVPTPGGEVAEIRDGERALTVPEHLRRFGDYELLEELGRGAMGVVYRARQLSLDREVAVKFLLAGPLASAEMIERFHREAVAAGALQHPNIVAVHEVGVHQGQHYLVMDTIAGSSLAQLISDFGYRISDFPRCVRWMRTIGRAVHYAHEHGILHRDLKPSNVLIDAEDQPHVMDFGLARSLVTDSRLTLSEQVLGSPCYLPPEQAGGGRTAVGRPSDVYALGAMLYHLLTGRPPFVGESPAEVIRAVLESEPTRPRLVNPRVPRDLEIICLKCLEKEPARRYATARELADDLERFLNNEPVRAQPVGFVGRAWRWRRRKPAQASLAVGLLLAVVLGLAGVLWQWSMTQATAVREIRERERAERTVYRLQIQTAEEYFARHRAAEGLAVLAALLRKDPADHAVAERLMSELTSRNWALPVFAPLAHTDPVHYAEYSPDGGRILTASLDNTARLWDALTGQPQGRPLKHDRGETFHPEVFTGGQKCLVAHFSPDGRRVATGSVDNSARVWDGHTGELLLAPLLHPDWVVDIAFSPDGQILATACRDGAVRRWRLSNGEAIEPTLRHADRAIFVEFDADGHWLLSGSQDGTARVWDAVTGEPVGKPLKHHGWVRAGQFSPDGQWVATGSADTTARLWHATTGEPASPPLRHDAAVTAVRFSPDGVWLATASFDQTIRLWDVPSGTARSRPLEHGGTVRSIQFSPEAQRLLSASEDKTVRVWDFRVGQPLMEPIRHTAAAWSARFSPDGQRIVTASSDNTCKVWDARPAAALATELGVNRAVRKLQWSPDGRRLIAQAAMPRLFVRSTGWSEVDDLWADQDTLSVEFSPDGGRIATGSSDGGARLWDVEKLEITLRVRHVGAVFSTCFSHDGQRLLTASSDRWAAVWNAETGEQLFTLTHPAQLRRAEFDLRSERILTVCDDDQVRVWNATTGDPLMAWQPHASRLNDAAFSPDGHRVVTCSEDCTARVWDTATARPLTCPLRHRGNVWSAVFSPDGHRLLTASEDNTAAIWEFSPALPAPMILRHQAAVYSARFSADGRRVATASQDQTARLWDAVTGQPIGSPWRHNGPVHDAVFSPDGTLVATAAGQSVWIRPVAQADPAVAQRWADLAEVVAGLREVNESSTESVAPVTFLELARQLETDPRASDPHGWLTWFLADRTQREAAPGTELTVAALLVREETNAQWDRLSGADLVQHLLALHPTSGWLHAQLARLRLKQYGQQSDPGLLREVEWLTQRALALSANHPAVWWTRADFLDRAGDQTGAIEAFERAGRLPDSSTGLTLAKAQCLERQGLLEPALAAYSRVLGDARGRSELGPGQLRLVWLARSRLHSQLGNAEDARRARHQAYCLDIPPRDPLAPVRLIDLTDFYTGDLNQDWRASRFPGHDLTGLVRGRQTLAGIEFDLRGLVQLSSVLLDARPLHFPRGVRGIPVEQRCRRLHFLHATDTAAAVGDLVATYAVNYADGQRKAIPVRYGVEAFPWDWECTPANPSTVVAWRGSNPARERGNLYCTTWTNPYPDAVVTAIDLESTMTSCAPFIVAITAE